MGLFDYLPNATIDRWLKERVLLQPDVTQCAIPKGIFAGPNGRAGEGAMLRMMAYGGESNFAYPPRPSDPKAVWEPEWAGRPFRRRACRPAAAPGNAGPARAGSRERIAHSESGQHPQGAVRPLAVCAAREPTLETA
jgi:hypothetical protein